MWNPEAPFNVHREIFNPYAHNGGSVAGIAGDDFAVLASDTRLSLKLSIYTRDQPKMFNLTDYSVMGASGSWNDSLTFSRIVQMHVIKYELEHRMKISTAATAQMMSILLYSKRFFPFLQMNILCGLDKCGKGCVYSFDPFGNMHDCKYVAIGSGSNLLLPFLDSQLKERTNKCLPSQEEALNILRDGFQSIAERDIMTGDSIMAKIITRDGISEKRYDLKKD